MRPRASVSSCAKLVMVLLLSCGGCAPPPRALPVVRAFHTELRNGFLWHVVTIENRSTEHLCQVDVTLTASGEREVFTITRHWSYWKPGEVKSVDVSASGGALQRLVIAGTAVRIANGQPVRLHGDFLWRHAPLP